MTLEMRDRENREIGMERGIEHGVLGMISALRSLDIASDVIIQKLQEEFSLSEDEALEYIRKST